MHVVVSMYLETVTPLRNPVFDPHIVAEERRISSACSLIAASSRFLELDEERLVFRRPGVRVTGGRGKEIGQRPGMSLRGHEAPMERDADVPQVLAVNLQ